MRRVAIIFTMPVIIAATGSTIQPGLWESSVRVDSMQIPNVPASMASSLAGQTHTIKRCLKAGDVESTPERVFAVTQGQCSYSNFSMKDGSVRGTLTCKGGVKSELTGRYTSTTYDLTSRTTMAGGVSSTSTVRGRLAASC
jgi:hypothetical protein